MNIKRRCNFIFLIIILLNCNQSFAEGQDGITSIINFGYSFMILTNIFFYTFILGIIIKYIFLNKNVKQRSLKAFTTSGIIAILLTIIYKDKFTFLIYNLL
jgi:hypothetical protein